MIRKCELRDIQELRLIAMETYTDTFGAHTSSADLEKYYDQAYTIEQLSKEQLEVHSEVYLFVQEKQIKGFLKLNWKEAQTEPMGDDKMEIQRIYVRKPYKHQGIGNQLMEFALKRAEDTKVSAVWLGVWEKNLAAQSFYFKHGFKHVGEHQFASGDQIDTDWIFERKLTNIH